MKLLKHHFLLLLLLFFSLSCEDQLDFNEENTDLLEAQNLPCGSPPVNLDPEKTVYQHGETVGLSWFVTFRANLESDLKSNLNCPNVQWDYILLRNGVLYRVLNNLPVDPDGFPAVTIPRLWQIPNDIPSGSGYQIAYASYDSCGNLDLSCTTPSQSFSILPSECTIGEPEVLESSYDLGTSLVYNVPTYSYDNERTFTVKIYKGTTLKAQNGPTDHSGAQPGLQNIIGAISLTPTTNFPVGNDYKVVFELTCESGTLLMERPFSIVASGSGGIVGPGGGLN